MEIELTMQHIKLFILNLGVAMAALITPTEGFGAPSFKTFFCCRICTRQAAPRGLRFRQRQLSPSVLRNCHFKGS